MNFNAYKILGAHPGMTDEQLKSHHRALSNKHHPDRAGGDQEVFMEVQEAYREVRNKDTRRIYWTRMHGLGTRCQTCDGRGFLRITKKFIEVDKRACPHCGADGFVPY